MRNHYESEIGKFKITSNTSVAAGIRRIEALRGGDVDIYLNEQMQKNKDQIVQIKK